MQEASKADSEKKESAMSSIPVLLVKGRVCEDKQRWRSACISLDGLLDYDVEDRDEGTLEMNLFAENFAEMLARDYGRLILSALYAERYCILLKMTALLSIQVSFGQKQVLETAKASFT